MIQFTTTLLKFGEKGEKTGWTYIEVPAELARQLKRDNKKSFRVKGRLDNYSFTAVALLPMGEGDFIMPVNAAMRKGTGKRKGATIKVRLELDESPLQLSKDLMQCLAGEPDAKEFFNRLPQGEKNYFSKWIESAKTESTKAKRIAQAMNGFSKGCRFGQMIRALKAQKDRQMQQ